MVTVAQLVRALDCDSGGRGFEPRQSPHVSLDRVAGGKTVFRIGVFGVLSALVIATAFSVAAAPAAITLPPEIRQAGVIRFAGDFTSAPAAYFDDGHVMRGSDYALCSAIAARLGVKAVWTNVTFGGLIPALRADRVDAICSAMYITPERSQVITFVPYRRSGHGAAVVKGNPHHITDLSDICGLSAVEVFGTVYEKTIKRQSTACLASGKAAVDLKTFATAADVAEQLTDGRADVWLAGDMILDYYMSKKPGTLEKAFSRKDLTLVAAGVAPRNLALAQAFSQALAEMQTDGSYQAILQQYDIPQEAITVFAVHPVTSEP
jgi:polar amino acid transport system substrate-binding protein